MSKKFFHLGADGFRTESLSYEATDFTNTGGVGQENKPVLTDAAGLIDATLVNFGAIDHGALGGLGDDDHTQYLLVDGTRAMAGNLQMNTNFVFSSGVPTDANHLINKAYADSLRTENGMKGNVEVATTANISLTGEQTIDGFLTSSSRILVKDQTDKKENGIYVTAAGAWARSEDMDNSPTAEIVNAVLIPRVQNSASGQEIQSFYISSVGTGVDGVHTIATDDIVFDVYTSSTQLSSGQGMAINGNVIDIDLADVDPGLYFDGNSDLGLLWSTVYTDSRAIKASDLSSVATGKGASILGLEDLGGYTDEVNVEGAIQDLFGRIEDFGTEYTAGTGGVAKGDLVFVSNNDEASAYATISVGNRAIGLALSAQTVGQQVRILANDTVLDGVLAGATAGDVYYWNGTGLQNTIPSGAGSYVWRCGIAKNATDLHVEIEFVKKNA